MADPAKHGKNKPKKPCVKLTQHEEYEIMDELFRAKTKIKDLAARYNVTPRTINNIKNRYKNDWEKLTFYMPGPVVDRKNSMTVEERILALGDDCASVMELSMNLAKFKLERDIKFMNDNPKNAGLLTMREVTEFFDKSASYVLTKKTGNIKAEKQKSGTDAFPKKLHKLFDEQTKLKNE